MKAFAYSNTGHYIGEVLCQLDQIKSKKTGKDIFLLPANSTMEKIPSYDKNTHIPVWDGTSWYIEELVICEEPTLTHEEINQKIVARIREKYSIDEEFKMINLGIADPSNETYILYRNYVAECIAWGDELENNK